MATEGFSLALNANSATKSEHTKILVNTASLDKNVKLTGYKLETDFSFLVAGKIQKQFIGVPLSNKVTGGVKSLSVDGILKGSVLNPKLCAQVFAE